MRFGIPVTRVPRTLLDLTPRIGDRQLARCVREALRLRTTSVTEIMDALTGRHRGRRGTRRLALAVARYSELPVHRARSGPEVEALIVLREGGRPTPRLNVRIAGEEADLSWPAHRLIIELDGPQYHLDRGEDDRKRACWEAAGWTVRRMPSPAVVDQPQRLLALAPPAERPPMAT